jgi:dTDP-4-dehydrorhamnose reductase
MKIVILGADGQLGRELSEKLVKSFSVYPLSRSDCDITNFAMFESVIKYIQPNIIINTAAYTNVDGAEDNFDEANEINNKSLLNMSKVANSFDAILVHFSTDYVFNVNNEIPIIEETQKNPINNYGFTKHLGEEVLIKNCKKYFIFRISWVYGQFGNNFPKKIISLAKEKETLKIINDQVGIPTSTSFIAETINIILSNKKYIDHFGIYNLSPSGSTTWFSFAIKLIDEIKINTDISLKIKEIIPVNSDEFITKAKRPKYSCLDNTKLKKMFKIKTYSWEDYLMNDLKDLL